MNRVGSAKLGSKPTLRRFDQGLSLRPKNTLPLPLHEKRPIKMTGLFKILCKAILLAATQKLQEEHKQVHEIQIQVQRAHDS